MALQPVHARCIALFGLAAGAALPAGCARGIVHAMPVARADLPSDEPLLQSLPIQEAYHWVDEDGRLTIALRFSHRSLLARELNSEWLMSLVLDRPPAGRERLYHLGTRELRLLQTRGPDRRRGRAYSGIVVIETPRPGTLRGRFHATVQQQVFTVLGGWSPWFRGPVMTTAGRFEAVPDAIKGREILARTEAGGFERLSEGQSPATSTAPARYEDP